MNISTSSAYRTPHTAPAHTMAAANANALVVSVVNGVQTAIKPELEKLAESLAQLQASLNGAVAAITVLTAATELPAGKRAVRGAGAAPAAKKAGAAAAGDAELKFGNALLFLRWACHTNYNGMRDQYLPEEVLATLKTKKGEAIKQGDGYYKAAASAIWETMTKEVKDEVRAQLVAWTEETARIKAEPPLEADE